jgi:hypothetical protein
MSAVAIWKRDGAFPSRFAISRTVTPLASRIARSQPLRGRGEFLAEENGAKDLPNCAARNVMNSGRIVLSWGIVYV